MTPLLQQIGLIAVAMSISLLLAEFVVRVGVEVPYRPPPAPLSPQSWRALLHRSSAVPGLAYELAPSTEKRAMGTPVRTNSLGMRDEEPLEGDDVLRIAAIGDSYTFGFGVHAEHAYPHQLEGLLQGACVGARPDVLNFGVGGYSTRDEALVLEHKALELEPRAVIVGYYLNDPQITPVQPLQRSFHGVEWWQHSHLLRLIAMHAHGRDLQRYGAGDYYRYLHHQPEKWSSVVAGFRRMAELAERADVPVLVAIFPATPLSSWADYPYRDLHEQVATAAQASGLEVLDLLAAFEQHEPSQLRLGPKDRHPTPLGHRVAAVALRDRIAEQLCPDGARR